MPDTLKATAWAPINIAVLKYWGKSDAELNIPLSDSFSVTLDGDNAPLGTTTSVQMTEAADDSVEYARINGTDYTVSISMKALKVLKSLKSSGGIDTSYRLAIDSTNHSPTASGLASSASGYAALALAIARCLGVSDKTTIGIAARCGSGSACRSVFGGFVHWFKGDSHYTSFARSEFSEEHWPELTCLIIRFDTNSKKVPSTEGMIRTEGTSELAAFRFDEKNVLQKKSMFWQAVDTRNFEEFAKLTVRDSNQLHAVCMDSYPPIRYLSEKSWEIIETIHGLNEESGRVLAGYTFDAGPHPVIFALKADMPAVKAALGKFKENFISCHVSEGAKIL